MGLDFDFSMLSAQDVLDIAVFIEVEAQENYEQIADWAGDKNPDAAKFFRKMAGWEALHASQISDQRKALFGDAASRYTHNAAWDVETPDYDKLGDALSVQDALQIAYDAEVRAERYYAGVMEYISDDKTLELLEGLRLSEVDHQRLIKEEMAKL